MPVNITQVVSSTIGEHSNTSITNSSNVTPGVETSILSHVFTDDFVLTDIFAVGDADGVYKVYVNGTQIAEGRTSSSQRMFTYSFSKGYELSSGDTIIITVTQYESKVENFRAFIFGVV